MKKLKIEDIKNIIKLLEDPEPKVFALLEPQLVIQEQDFYSSLKAELKNNTNQLVKDRLEKVFLNVYYNNIDKLFRNIPLLENGDMDLEAGTFLLATFGYPELNIDEYKKQIDIMADKLNQKVKNILDPLTLIEAVNEFVFVEEGFQGNQIDYMDPDNTFINMVIDRRTGIPITLSVIYLFLAKRLSLPFNGIGMPGHFILQYKKDNFEVFIDPYYSGQILSKKDCINFLFFSGYGFLDRYLDVTSNKEILKRMIRNLLLIYKDQNNDKKYDKLREILNIIDVNY
jgi:regulator of sirC expression with transglutaminase-like and TPR domain